MPWYRYPGRKQSQVPAVRVKHSTAGSRHASDLCGVSGCTAHLLKPCTLVYFLKQAIEFVDLLLFHCQVAFQMNEGTMSASPYLAAVASAAVAEESGGSQCGTGPRYVGVPCWYQQQLGLSSGCPSMMFIKPYSSKHETRA